MFEFNEKNHAYKLDGKRLTGVTTILGIADFGKSDGLIQWTANQAVDYIKNNSYKAKGTENIVLGNEFILENAKTAWKRTRDKAGDIGSIVHKLIEIYVKNKIDKTEFHYERAKEDALLESNTELTEEEDKKIFPMFEQFLNWEKEENIEFLLSEQKLYSRKHWFAGTVDLVFKKDGNIYIGDIKTSRDIYITHFIQMGGYQIMLEELNKIKYCAGYCVINIPKRIKKDGTGTKKVKFVSNPDVYVEAFLHCLGLYRFKGLFGTTPAKKKRGITS